MRPGRERLSAGAGQRIWHRGVLLLLVFFLGGGWGEPPDEAGTLGYSVFQGKTKLDAMYLLDTPLPNSPAGRSHHQG